MEPFTPGADRPAATARRTFETRDAVLELCRRVIADAGEDGGKFWSYTLMAGNAAPILLAVAPEQQTC